MGKGAGRCGGVKKGVEKCDGVSKDGQEIWWCKKGSGEM